MHRKAYNWEKSAARGAKKITGAGHRLLVHAAMEYTDKYPEVLELHVGPRVDLLKDYLVDYVEYYAIPCKGRTTSP
ncbi:hypothetical protein [Salininema proteolyticum]|uniref:Uncharacterized protein n=1 Tax=Salininema proteolyticum TaxID=1607685 RepID=A0ABV8U392_9ACTN